MITYSVAISACDEVKQFGMAMELHHGLEPYVVTYRTAISARNTTNQLDRCWCSVVARS